MKIYIAGPLFSSAEKRFNEEIDYHLQSMGFDTFLPQRDGYEKSQCIDKTESEDGVSKKEILVKLDASIFSKDTQEIRNCDILLIILDGRVPDEGACVELGFAFALNKKCIGIKTDSRTLLAGQDNPMIMGCLENTVAHSIQDLKNILKEYIK
jgi:nucleoside 2-deoxyribosyltransferase